MRRLTLGLSLALLLALCLPLTAQDYMTTETITVAATAIGFTSTTINPPGLPQMQKCVCRLETAEIRYWTDGGTPTSTVGTPLEPLEVLTISGHGELDRFRAIRTGSTSGVLSCQCYQAR